MFKFVKKAQNAISTSVAGLAALVFANTASAQVDISAALTAGETDLNTVIYGVGGLLITVSLLILAFNVAKSMARGRG